ncbi:MAG: 3-deoxy-8-phosphooctulonate synthase, partial [Pseudomonadota bacterium]|nr:3-deoxy-8-phosphooctulonate synthase [Pseudomonadota bacterium]
MYQLKGYDGISIGAGQPLLVMAGLNVLEDEGLALEVADELKQICSDLSLPFVFKASFDKANRSSITSYRGPGQADGMAMLASVKAAHGLPIVTDIHTPEQADEVAEIAEIVQLPAFLVRQTDLAVAAAKAVARNGGWLHAKKAQFLAPWDCANIISKV